MKLVDTHAHIYLPEFSHDIQEVISRAAENNINNIILPSIDSTHFLKQSELVQRYPDFLISLAGLHPSSVNKEYQKELQFVYEQLTTTQFAGVGEVGIDLYWDKTFLKEQIIAFETQIAWAVEFELPLVIHQRNSFPEIFSVLDNFSSSQIRGVFHCYAGDVATAEACIKRGFLLGIGGVVTFKKSQMADVVKAMPLETIVLETDAPYLAPIPYRGKRNEPAFIVQIASKVSEIKGVDIEEVAEVTTANAETLFAL